MKVLWITNILFPDVCEALALPVQPVGGWLYSSAKLLCSPDTELAVAAIYPGKDFQVLIIDNIKYYLLPFRENPIKYDKQLEIYWKLVEKEYMPDIVHIHGTEFSHGLAYLKSCKSDKVVVSIQGLVSVCERYYCAGLSIKDIVKNITFRDLIKNDNIFQQRKSFKKRGESEKIYIRLSKYVIGRTHWDEVHVKTLNPNIKYFFCNETLRLSFYEKRWDIDKCIPYSIFLSQASYPIKGLHQVLKALPLVLKEYPNAKLYVAGTDCFNCNTLTKRVRLNGYAKLIKKMIRQLKLDQHVVFLGMLDEVSMRERYLNSHLFICPSSIENSPNSLGEAQLLGLPCIATYTGGIPDMIDVGQSGLLYPFEEFEMLGQQICSVFACRTLALHLSENARLKAADRHNLSKCRNRMLDIYDEIAKETS